MAVTEKDRKSPREEFEIDYYTKELGRPLQRKLLQRRLEDFTDISIAVARHGEESSDFRAPPPEDRAG